MNAIIREARPDDAVQIIALMEQLAVEPGISISLGPGEFRHTLEQEQAFLAEIPRLDNSVFLVAEANGSVIGILTLLGGQRKSQRHAADLSIVIHPGWRDQGLGRRLMQTAIDWARASGVLKRIELSVFVRNQLAIHLYEALGFEIEGRRRASVFRDGAYHDDTIMALLL